VAVPTPTEVFPDRIVRDVSVDLGVICIVDSSEAVLCQGSDGFDAVTGSRLLAGAGYPGRYRSVFVGTLVFCVVSVDDAAFCWGQNDVGQVYPDSVTEKLTQPMLVAENVSSIAIARSFGCAVHLDGTVRCWGRDGVDSVNARIGRVAAIAVGTLGTWLLNEAGEVWSLGSTHPLAGGSDAMPANSQFRAQSVAAGFGHACAVADDGGVWCWGGNLNGVLGTGTRSPSPSPVRVFP
jgi:hypothetical protein